MSANAGLRLLYLLTTFFLGIAQGSHTPLGAGLSLPLPQGLWLSPLLVIGPQKFTADEWHQSELLAVAPLPSAGVHGLGGKESMWAGPERGVDWSVEDSAQNQF